MRFGIDILELGRTLGGRWCRTLREGVLQEEKRGEERGGKGVQFLACAEFFS